MNTINSKLKATLILAALVLWSGTLTFAQSTNIVNAASLKAGAVAPGSIISIFGSNFMTGVAVSPSATNPPTTLGTTTVTIGGHAAALFYASPTQINAVVDPATPTGTQTVVITSSAGTQQGSVVIDANASPGLFALNGLGTGDGAFVNALTALLGPFTPGTTNGQTYLEFFLTGLNLSVKPTVTIGGVAATVLFWGASPCCDGLDQINVQIPLTLAGAGRVPVVVSDNGTTSNSVDVVLLPPSNQKEFPDDRDDHERGRELASVASVPGTSLVLSTDENDDVVRVIDVSAKSVTKVIALSDGAAPDGIAVNAGGTIAVVAERGLGSAAIINLAAFAVVAEVSTGTGAAPVSVAIAGNLAVVVNRDTRTASIVDLTTNAVVKTITVGSGPRGVAVNAATKVAYVTNENDGTISVIDLTSLAVTSTITVNATSRIEAIVVLPSAGVAFVTAPGSREAFLVNLTTNVATSIAANATGVGSTDVAVSGSKIYFANQAGGSVSVLTIDPTTGLAAGAVATVKVDLGARALAIDAKDNLLVVSNEGTGTLVLVDLTTNTVVGRINAVKSNSSGDDNGDDHSDHDGSAVNLPTIGSISPVSGTAGSSFQMTIMGTNLTGATGVAFVFPGSIHGESMNAFTDASFTATSVQVNAAGTQLTATVTIGASASLGSRIVRVATPKGSSGLEVSSAATFTVTH
ncbi:MAG TPA: IPT/TIG domain-containing protein [Bryobacteraceae bacterium]|jgi:uncharacterized protein (TIGR03437 family)|nr:IPT/TIG domain-containing protein [Bryobacteraceae bacterium]